MPGDRGPKPGCLTHFPFLLRSRRHRVWCLSRDAAADSMTSEVIEDEKQFYSKAETYWKEVPATVDGMLGGYGHISSIDINSSRKFLQRFLRVGRSGVLSRRRAHIHHPGLDERVGRASS